MDKETPIEAYNFIGVYNLNDNLPGLIKRTPENLLPLLVNHKNDYVKWAVNQRLSNQSDLSIESYLKAELT